MYKTYLRQHSDGKMESVTRGLDPASALTEYKRLLARDDLIGEKWAAVLRDDVLRKTIYFSRFDREDQRLVPSDDLDLILHGGLDTDSMTREIIYRRDDN